VSGKIITRVRERQDLEQRNTRLHAAAEAEHAAAEAKREMYAKLRAAALKEMSERDCYSGHDGGETPSAYASDPISRFFRWVFRL
jgi:hypothetical protein